MNEMSARQRYQRLFQGLPVDRIPVCPRVHRNVVFEHFRDATVDEEFLARCAEFYRHYGFDAIDWNCTPAGLVQMNEFTSPGPQWRPTVTEEVRGKTRHVTTTVETPAGSLRRVLGITRTGPWEEEVALVEYPIKTERDFELIAEYLPAVAPVDTSSIRAMKALLGDQGITSPSMHGVFNLLAYCYRKPDDLLLDPLVHPEWYRRMMDYFLQRCRDYGQQMIDAGADLVDLGANVAGGNTVSASFLVEHILDYENQLADLFQQQGVPALYHNCGFAANHLQVYDQVHHRLWGYLAPAPHGDVVLEDVLESVPRDMILWGHVDQIDFLRQATPREVEQRVQYICETMKGRGNFILGTTDHLEVNTPPENLRALVAACHTHGRYGGAMSATFS